MADKNDKNPRNSESTLFKKLTRLFSGPLVNRRSQGYRSQRRQALDKYRFQSASGQNFKKSQYNPFESLGTNYMTQNRRAERYVDFEQMEYSPELASALDIYADEMTTSTSLEKMMSIKCPNEEIKSVLEALYHNILNIDFNLFGWCRTMCKYGDFFLYLDIDEHIGIKSVVGLPPAEVERLEGEDPTNPNYIQFQWNSGGLTFENWQVAHFRVLGNDKYSPYGTSVLDPARRIWRQLILLEDAMMAYRVVRSPERRVFYVDVGAVAPEDVEQYMQKIISQMKRSQVVDQETGRIDLRYNPMSVEEDYFLPVRGNQTNTRIESLAGGQYTGDIDDVKYLRDKLFSAIKIPASYLSSGEEAAEDKTTLAQKDIRFARTIQRLQRAVLSELEKIGIIHLYTLGFRGDDLISFNLSLNNPSKLAVLQELETWGTKFDTAANATEGYFSKRWVAQNILGMSDDEFLRNQREMFYDRKMQAMLDASAEAAMAETAAAGGAGMAGMDDLATADAELADPTAADAAAETPLLDEPGATPEPAEAPAAPGPEDTGAEDETLLSAPPGKRDDKVRTYEKSTYRLKDRDNRKHSAPRKKNASGHSHSEIASGNLRSLGFTQLAKGIYEEVENNYNEEEDKVFKIKKSHNDVKILIEQMESQKDEKNKVQE